MAVFDNLTHSYGDKILFLGAELEVEQDRIAVVGPNGAGEVNAAAPGDGDRAAG